MHACPLQPWPRLRARLLVGRPVEATEVTAGPVDPDRGQQAAAGLRQAGQTVLAELRAAAGHPSPIEAEVVSEGVQATGRGRRGRQRVRSGVAADLGVLA